MPNAAPYSDLVGSADPLSLLASTPKQIAELVKDWDSRRWAMTYPSGKWTGAQLILHLTHDEIGWCNRIRLALAVRDYVVQAYDGAYWVDLETPTAPELSLNAYLALRNFNLTLFRRLSAQQRRRPFLHPEVGEISIDWILNLLAGHDLHHFRHLQSIASL